MMTTPGMKLVLLVAEALTLVSAVLVALHPNILYASISLLFTFLGIAVIFVFAGADFVAGAQVVVYVGGVTVLVLFAIMLTQWLTQVKLRDVRAKMFLPLVIIGGGIVPVLYRVLTELGAFVEKNPPANVETFSAAPKTNLIGQALLTTYLLPFELITILLLGALVGAVWLARPK